MTYIDCGAIVTVTRPALAPTLTSRIVGAVQLLFGDSSWPPAKFGRGQVRSQTSTIQNCQPQLLRCSHEVRGALTVAVDRPHTHGRFGDSAQSLRESGLARGPQRSRMTLRESGLVHNATLQHHADLSGQRTRADVLRSAIAQASVDEASVGIMHLLQWHLRILIMCLRDVGWC